MQFDRTPEIASKLVADSDNNLNSISSYILHYFNLGPGYRYFPHTIVTVCLYIKA